MSKKDTKKQGNANPQATNAKETYAMRVKKKSIQGKEQQGNPPQHS